MNTVVVSGVVGKEPSVNDSGKVAIVSFAVTDKLKDAKGNTKTSWISLKVLGEKKVATIHKWWTKGTKLMVQGSLDFKQEKKGDYYNHYDYVLVESWEFIGSKNKSESGENTEGDIPASSKEDFVPVSDNMDIDSIFS